MPHILLSAGVRVASVLRHLNADHCENCHCYSHADSVVEVNERLRRFSASPLLSSM